MLPSIVDRAENANIKLPGFARVFLIADLYSDEGNFGVFKLAWLLVYSAFQLIVYILQINESILHHKIWIGDKHDINIALRNPQPGRIWPIYLNLQV